MVMSSVVLINSFRGAGKCDGARIFHQVVLRFRLTVTQTHPKSLLHPGTYPWPEGHLSSTAKDGDLAGNPGNKGLRTRRCLKTQAQNFIFETVQMWAIINESLFIYFTAAL